MIPGSLDDSFVAGTQKSAEATVIQESFEVPRDVHLTYVTKMFAVNLETINCFFNCRPCHDAHELRTTLSDMREHADNSSPHVYLSMVLGKLIFATRANAGFIYRALAGSAMSYETMAAYGIPADTPLWAVNVYNIPLRHNGSLVGTLGLAFTRKPSKALVEDLDDIIGVLSEYLSSL